MLTKPKFEPHVPREAAQPLALAGVRVVDFSHMLAGPFCTQTLADMGAEVIKVESPDGDDCRGYKPAGWEGEGAYFQSANRNKKSISLDLKHPDGLRIAKALIARSDVLVENFSNGVMERLGLGYAGLAAEYPRLVYCSISAYGRDDSSVPPRTGYDAMFQAGSGFMSLTGESDGPPMRTTVPVMDILTASVSASAILAALLARDRLGRGQFVEVPLFDVAMSSLTFYGMSYLVYGENPVRNGNRAALSAPSDAYETQSGWVFLTCGTDRLFRRLVTEGLARPELAEDPDFASPGLRAAHQEKLTRILAPIFKGATREHWLAHLGGIGVPIAPILSVEQAFHSEDARRRRVVSDIPHAIAGTVATVRPPFHFSLTPVADPVAAPLLGQHTEHVLSEVLGYAGDELSRALASDGVRSHGLTE